VGLPLTANSMEELSCMSFPGIVFDECPACGEAHDIDRDECFLLDDDGGTPVALRR
jgi:hypothetical protein